MVRIKIVIILFSLAFFLHSSANAQTYRTALGARLGHPLSASYKTFLAASSNAIEVHVGTWGYSRYRRMNASVGYQVHRPIPDLEGLMWYFGAGGSVFFWNWKGDHGEGELNTSFGIQGYLGLDYAFSDAPINISVDWVPLFFVNGYGNGFSGTFGAVGVRYILARG